MRCFFLGRLTVVALLMAGLAATACSQQVLTWQQVRDKSESTNPSLRAGQMRIDESRAAEIGAQLRPNPNLGLTVDQINPFSGGPPYSAAGSLLTVAAVSYLPERRSKRELRLEGPQKATGIVVSGQADLERTLIFTLRTAFLQALQEKAIVGLAKENLAYYDHVLDVNREQYQAGAIAQVDLDRLELQCVQYESDRQIAEASLETAKILLLALLNDRTPVDQFDLTGPLYFSRGIVPLDQVRQEALDTRPDLRASLLSVDQAKTDQRLAVANGSTDPTFGFDAGRNPPIDQYIGFSVNIPLRIFDRDQREKKRTELEIERSEKLVEAARAQVFADVDSAYASVTIVVTLLQPYQDRYLQQASRVPDTIAFSYEHGAGSLLDFLNAQSEYRSVQVNYLNLIASYLDVANQLNLAVGREVIQ
jgi:outer membrane protein, heavy metal efflux system